ncbi:hypothetical protein HRI_002183300 [Hibiscus trionum]|uniref:Reverse transcriptase domain-containing protein n=1 Tax=Hibiscus trionum TaxID=183268 RepID=A0A9W7HVJ1_HIBTR|nr:hypothetical protein HRI_002183300 [Hibiscus trionum]
MEAFRAVLRDCELSDLGFTGNWYTWECGRLVTNNVRERLDRGVASDSWRDYFPNFSVTHLNHSISDHCPLLFDTANTPASNSYRAWFRFDANWTLDPDCEDIISSFWSSTSGDLPTKLNQLSSILSNWNKEKRLQKRHRTAVLNNKLKHLSALDADDENLAELLEVKLAMNLEADKDEIYWEQRAHTNWLKHGDRNTRFFHNWASFRRKSNRVTSLRDDDGRLFTTESDMAKVAESYFSNLFTTSSIGNSDFISNLVTPIVSEDMNNKLLVPFTKEEIFGAVKSMAPLKASGQNGFPALFYQSYWHIVSKEVVDFCLGVLNDGKDFSTINGANIVLIPKVENPSSMTQFRPISLCSVLYKIIAKSIVNRLCVLLDLCINPTQGAFVPGRHISDNILIAYEVLHSLKNRKAGRNGAFALKLDMSKAYDRVEWPFVRKMMSSLGFSNQWLDLIFRCVSSVSYRIVFNGVPGASFSPSRGLRQGDPLSPYLFLFCAEGLSALINAAKQNGEIKGVKVGRSGVTLTHLFFADDCILFGDTSSTGIQALKHLLLCYERISGQKINFDKSLIYFSSNVNPTDRQDIGNEYGVRISNNPENYLGLPTMVGRNKRGAFASLLDSTNRKVEGWSCRFLSMGGKEVFLKSVLQAIPIYAMQCFLFPLSLCHDLESIYCRFWWRNNGSKRGIHWARWESLCSPKDKGGMGFRDLAKFNIAILAKQGWHLLTNPSSLLARVLKGRYFPTGNFLSANLGSNPSYTWKSIWCTRGLIEKGFGWRIGCGSAINIWTDPWITDDADGRVHNTPINPMFQRVSDLICPVTNNWKLDVVTSLFSNAQARNILQMKLPMHRQEDFIIWRADKSGTYSVRSGYKLLCVSNTNPYGFSNHEQSTTVFRSLWLAKLPSKVKISVWRFCMNYLPTSVNLHIRKLNPHLPCRFCGLQAESVFHLASNCPFTARIFSDLHILIPITAGEQNWLEWLANLFEPLSSPMLNLLIAAIWAIWTFRNKRVYENATHSPEEIVRFIRSFVAEHEAVNVKPISGPPSAASVHWLPPTGDVVKINFDASFTVNSGQSVSGIVIRNSEGLVMATGTYPHSHIANPEIAEACACDQALSLASDLGFRKVILEGDALSVVNKIASPASDKSDTFAITSNIKRKWRSFETCSIQHVNRRCNEAAHTLAILGRNFSSPRIWIEEAPARVAAIVERDRLTVFPPV